MKQDHHVSIYAYKTLDKKNKKNINILYKKKKIKDKVKQLKFI